MEVNQNQFAIVEYQPPQSSLMTSAYNAIVSYLSPQPLSQEEKERETKMKQIEILRNKMAQIRQIILENQKTFESGWKLTHDCQITALTLNMEAFETMKILVCAIQKFISNVSVDPMQEILKQNVRCPAIIQSPLPELCKEMKAQVIYYTSAEEKREISRGNFTTLDLIKACEEMKSMLVEHELTRITNKLEKRIEEIKKGKKPISSPDVAKVKVFDSVETAFKKRKSLESALNPYLAGLNKSISNLLDIEMPVEDLTASNTSYLGWLSASKNSIEEKALPEYSKKHLIATYNGINVKASLALEEFRRKRSELDTQAEGLISSKRHLIDLVNQKNRLEHVPEIYEILGDVDTEQNFSDSEEEQETNHDGRLETEKNLAASIVPESELFLNPQQQRSTNSYAYLYNIYAPPQTSGYSSEEIEGDEDL